MPLLVASGCTLACVPPQTPHKPWQGALCSPGARHCHRAPLGILALPSVQAASRARGPGPIKGSGALRQGCSPSEEFEGMGTQGWGSSRHLGIAVRWTCGPTERALLAPPPLLPRGLPGNIFLINVYIFGDSWFICGQSVPGERHTGHSRLADGGSLTAQRCQGAAPCPGALALPSLALLCSEALTVGLKSPLAEPWHRFN